MWHVVGGPYGSMWWVDGQVISFNT